MTAQTPGDDRFEQPTALKPVDAYNSTGTAAQTQPTTWRKKPVVIDAWQVSSRMDYPRWLLDAVCLGTILRAAGGGAVFVSTLEGTMRADPGDWIIKGVKGELYPCKPDIFAATYEPATSPPPAVMKAPEAEGDARAQLIALLMAHVRPGPIRKLLDPKPSIDEIERNLNSDNPRRLDLSGDGNIYELSDAPALTVGKLADALIAAGYSRSLPPAVPTDAEIARIEKRHARVATWIDTPFKLDEAVARRLAQAHLDRATLLRRLKAQDKASAPAATMPGRNEIALAVSKVFCDELVPPKQDTSPVKSDYKVADAILALWNGRA